MVCLEKMLNFDDFTSLRFSYILGTGIRLLLSNHKTKVSQRVRINLLLFQMQFFDLIQLDVVPIDK